MKSMLSSQLRWTAAAHGARQIGLGVVTFVLARILAPSDFGLFAMAKVIVVFVTLFSDGGTLEAIVQRRTHSDEFLSSMFWFNAGLGLLAALLVYAAAPLAAGVYGEPEVAPILRGLALLFVFAGCSMPLEAVMRHKLMLREIGWIEVAATVLGGLAGILTTLAGAPRWSLVCQALAAAAAAAVGVWLMTPWRPVARFHFTEVKSSSGFSLNLIGFRVINYLMRNMDNFLIGKYLGPRELGYYDLAYRLMFYPLFGVSSIMGRVSFPVFSRRQDDEAWMKTAYLKAIKAIAFITFPMMLGLMVSSHEFIVAVFGRPWEPTARPLTLLCVAGLIQSILAMNGVIYGAKGRMDVQFRVALVLLAPVLAAFLIGLRWGIVGVAACYCLVVCATAYPSFKACLSLIQVKPHELPRALGITLLNSVIMWAFLLGLKAILPPMVESASLVLMVLSGAAVYLGIAWIINRGQMAEVSRHLWVR